MYFFARLFVILLAPFVGISAAIAGWDAYTTANVNMREGPSTRYRVIVTIPAGEPVYVHGCLETRFWCDVEWQWHRGFVYARYLSEAIQRYPNYSIPPFIIIEPRYRDRIYIPRRDHRERYEPPKPKKFKKYKPRKIYGKPKPPKKRYQQPAKRKTFKKPVKRKSDQNVSKQKKYSGQNSAAQSATKRIGKVPVEVKSKRKKRKKKERD